MKRMLLVLALLAASATPSLAAPGDRVMSALKSVQTARYLFRSGLLNTIFAKETCSCLYVDQTPFETCQASDNLPALVHRVVKVTAPVAYNDPDMSKDRLVTVAFTPAARLIVPVHLGPSAAARYMGPEFGCVMVTPPPPGL